MCFPCIIHKNIFLPDRSYISLKTIDGQSVTTRFKFNLKKEGGNKEEKRKKKEIIRKEEKVLFSREIEREEEEEEKEEEEEGEKKKKKKKKQNLVRVRDRRIKRKRSISILNNIW